MPIAKLFARAVLTLRHSSLSTMLARIASASLLVKIAGTAFAFGSHILLARLAGAEEFGIYIFVINWVFLAVLFGKLGFQGAAVRFVAALKQRNEYSELRGFYFSASATTLFFAVCISTFAVVALYLQIIPWTGSLLATAFAGCLLIPIRVQLDLTNSYLLGLKQVIPSMITTEVLLPLGLIIVVAATHWFNPTLLSGKYLLLTNAAITSVLIILALTLFVRALPKGIERQPRSFHFAKWFKVALPLLLISSLNLIMSRADTLMIGMIMNTTNAGIYSAASRLAALSLFGMVASNAIAAPLIAERYASGSSADLQQIVTSTNLFSGLFFIAAVIVLVPFGPSLLSLWGEEFTIGYAALVFLLIGQCVNAFAACSGWILTMTIHERVAAIILGLAALVNIVLNVLLVPNYGMIGAAIATSVSVIAANIALTSVAWVRLGIKPVAFRGEETK